MGFLTVGLSNSQDILSDNIWENWTISDSLGCVKLYNLISLMKYKLMID